MLENCHISNIDDDDLFKKIEMIQIMPIECNTTNTILNFSYKINTCPVSYLRYYC